MKKPQVSFSFPAKILNFESVKKEGNEMFSRGKLKVFYKGETADHRYFSDEFSDELIKSLPYTPIVSYYDTEKKDFKGHAAHQAIYGIVDPKGEITFETDDYGVKWALCDTIYYTERPDEVGEIAKQIEGHSQSLELTDAKYVVNYDERRHFKNIEFTAGKFIGVSVLGKDQQPAFTGSSFFSAAETDEEFAKKMKILKDFVDSENGQKENVSNGGQMKITSYEGFMKLSWGDISSKVNEAISSEYGKEAYTYIADMDNSFAYVVFYSYIDGKQSTQKIAYSVDENGNVTLGAVTPVHREWVDDATEAPAPAASANAEVQETPNVKEETSAEGQPEAGSEATVAAENQASTEEAGNGAEGTVVTAEEEPNSSENGTGVSATGEGEGVSTNAEEIAPDTTLAKVETAEVQTDNDSVEENSGSPEVANAGEASTGPVVEAEIPSESQLSNASGVSGTEDGHEDTNVQEENSSTSTLTDSERAEFEALKLQERVHLIESYKDKISEDDFTNFSANVASYEDNEKLELDLLRAFKSNEEKKAKEETEKETTRSYNRAVFASLLTTNAKTKESSDDDDSWVAKHR